MASTFNLTAQLNLRGPANVRQVVSRIRRDIGSIKASINLNVDQTTNRNITRINASLNTLNTTLSTTTVNARNAADAINRLASAASSLSNVNVANQVANTSAATQQLAQNTAQAADNTNRARTQMEEFGRQSALAIRRYAAFTIVTQSIFAVSNAIRQGVKAFIDYDRQLVKLQQITGESAEGLKNLSATVSSLSTSLGVSSSELIGVSSTLAQAGLNAKETEKALKALALSSLAPSFDNLNKTVEGSIALMRQFGISAGDLEKALGSVNAVAAQFAVESGDIIAAIQRTGGVFAAASRGVSEGTDALNEFIAVFTSVRATTRESAETIATGLRTIFTRIQRGSTIEALKEYGVTLTDVEGKFVGAYKAIELLSKGLNTLDPRDIKFSEIVEELGGFRQIGKVIPLIQQFSTAQEALKAAQRGQSSLAEDAATAQGSLAVQFAKVREEFTALIRDIGGSGTFQALAKGALSLASSLIKIADTVKDILPLVGVFTAIRAVSAARQFGSGFLGGLRNPKGNAQGGIIRRYKSGGMVDVALMPGETVIPPEEVKKAGVSKLRKINHADKNKRKKFSIGGYALVPGSGNTDSFYTQLSEGSFVIRKKATEALGGPDGVASAARQKFARGGAANLPATRPYVKNVPTTYNKQAKAPISEAVKAEEKLVLNKRDTIESNIKRVPLNVEDLYKKKGSPLLEQYKQAPNPIARGRAFEEVVRRRKGITKPSSPTSRLDGMKRNNQFVEIRSREEQSSTGVLLDKIAGAIFRPRSNVDQKASERASRERLSNKPDTISFGSLTVYEDKSPLLKNKKTARTQKEIEAAEEKRTVKRKKGFFGGLIQKFGGGSLQAVKKKKQGIDIQTGKGRVKEGLRKGSPNDPSGMQAFGKAMGKEYLKINQDYANGTIDRDTQKKLLKAYEKKWVDYLAKGSYLEGRPLPQSVSPNIPPELLSELGKKGRLTYSTGLEGTEKGAPEVLLPVRYHIRNNKKNKSTADPSGVDKRSRTNFLKRTADGAAVDLAKSREIELTPEQRHTLSSNILSEAGGTTQQTLADLQAKKGTKTKEELLEQYHKQGYAFDPSVVSKEIAGSSERAANVTGIIKSWDKSLKSGQIIPLGLDASDIEYFKSEISNENIRKALAAKYPSKMKTFDADFDRLLAGDPVIKKGKPVAGRITHVGEILKAVMAGNYANGGMVQKFGGGTYEPLKVSKRSGGVSNAAIERLLETSSTEEAISILNETLKSPGIGVAGRVKIEKALASLAPASTVPKQVVANKAAAQQSTDPSASPSRMSKEAEAIIVSLYGKSSKRRVKGPLTGKELNITTVSLEEMVPHLPKSVEAEVREHGMRAILGVSKLISEGLGIEDPLKKMSEKERTARLEQIYDVVKGGMPGVAFEGGLAAVTGAKLPDPGTKRPLDLPYGIPKGEFTEVTGIPPEIRADAKAVKKPKDTHSERIDKQVDRALVLEEDKKKGKGKGNGKRPSARLSVGGEIPIMAQKGEYVINKDSAQAIGYENLDNLNRYHDGGVVQNFKTGSKKPLSLSPFGSKTRPDSRKDKRGQIRQQEQAQLRREVLAKEAADRAARERLIQERQQENTRGSTQRTINDITKEQKQSQSTLKQNFGSDPLGQLLNKGAANTPRSDAGGRAAEKQQAIDKLRQTPQAQAKRLQRSNQAPLNEQAPVPISSKTRDKLQANKERLEKRKTRAESRNFVDPLVGKKTPLQMIEEKRAIAEQEKQERKAAARVKRQEKEGQLTGLTDKETVARQQLEETKRTKGKRSSEYKEASSNYSAIRREREALSGELNPAQARQEAENKQKQQQERRRGQQKAKEQNSQSKLGITSAQDPKAITGITGRKFALGQGGPGDSAANTEKINQYYEKSLKIVADKLRKTGASQEAVDKGLAKYKQILLKTGNAQEALEASLKTTAKSSAVGVVTNQKTLRENIQYNQDVKTKGTVGAMGSSLTRRGQDLSKTDRSGMGIFKSIGTDLRAQLLKVTGGLVSAVGKPIKAMSDFGSSLKIITSPVSGAARSISTWSQSIVQANGFMNKLKAVVAPASSAIQKYTTSIKQASTGTAKLKAIVAPIMSPFKALAQAASNAASKLKFVGTTSKSAPVPPGTPGTPGATPPQKPGGADRLKGAAFGLSMAVPMLAGLFTSEEPKSAEQASMNAGVGTAAAGIGAAGMFASMGTTGAVAGLGIAAFSAVKALDDAAKAAKQFRITELKNKIDSSGETIEKVFKEIGDSSEMLPRQLNQLNAAIKQSAEAAIEAANLRSQANPSIMGQIATLFIGGVTGRVGGVGDSSASNRELIFQEKGFMALYRAMRSTEDEFDELASIAPKIAKENAKAFQQSAAQITQVWSKQIMSGAASMEDIINSDDFAKQSEVLARSNAQIEQQIILINASNSLSAQEKKARIDSIVAIEAEAQSRKIFKQIQLEKDLKELKKGLNQVSFSFKRMLDNMSSSIDLASAKIEAFGESMELASSSAKGQAKVGTGSGIDNLINTLKNPRAASETQRQASFSQASSMFGGQASNVENILTTGAGLEDTILGTINRTLSTAGSAETNEAVGAKVSNAVKEQLRNLSIPPAIADKLSSQIEKAVSKLRTQGDDTIDFSQIVEEVPELAKSIDIFSNVNKSVIKSLEFLKSQFDLLASATNQQIELQLQVNKTLRDAQNIIIKGNQNLSRALGRDASLGEQRTAIETPLRSMAGTTNPNQIGMNFRDLENTRSQLQEGRAGAARSGDVDLVKQFDNKLRDTNIAISENVAALQQMANSTELASAALNEIEKIQRKTQAGASIIEKLVTSTPKEIGSMNRAFARLSNNMMGMTNVGGNTETRKQSLEMFQMIAPLLGDNGGLKANVLQSMLAESGVAMTPVMQQVLDAMRNPESDPQMQQAIATYQQAINTQSQANVELAKINQNLSNDIAKKTGDAVAAAIQGVEIKFNQQQINDILNGINSVPDQPAPAQGIATGGLVYRAVGGTIDRKVFKPRGTDTVPAMLTPGEFVVNRSATQANLPLLQSINNGYQRGGQVKYYSTGGHVSGRYVSNFLKLDD